MSLRLFTTNSCVWSSSSGVFSFWRSVIERSRQLGRWKGRPASDVQVLSNYTSASVGDYTSIIGNNGKTWRMNKINKQWKVKKIYTKNNNQKAISKFHFIVMIPLYICEPSISLIALTCYTHLQMCKCVCVNVRVCFIRQVCLCVCALELVCVFVCLCVWVLKDCSVALHNETGTVIVSNLFSAFSFNANTVTQDQRSGSVPR